MLSILFWLPLSSPILWIHVFIEAFSLFFFRLLHLCLSFIALMGLLIALLLLVHLDSVTVSVSISVFLLEFPGRRLALENNHQTAVRALDLLTHTYTLSPVYRPGLGAVMLLVHSLPRTDLVALVSKLLLAILGFFITVRLVYTGTEVDCSLRCCCHITQPWRGALNSTSNYWYVALAYIFPLVEHVSCCWRRRRSQCRYLV